MICMCFTPANAPTGQVRTELFETPQPEDVVPFEPVLMSPSHADGGRGTAAELGQSVSRRCFSPCIRTYPATQR